MLQRKLGNSESYAHIEGIHREMRNGLRLRHFVNYQLNTIQAEKGLSHTYSEAFNFH
jgi:hypothetical protein